MEARLEILWCDDALLVVNKPAGLPTLPDGYHPGLPHVKSMLEPIYGRLWIVHRLDKDTSGVLALARTAQAHRSLNTQFEKHTLTKVYHALVIGSPGWEETTVRLPLHPNGDRRHRTVVDSQSGKPAITHLRLLERLAGYALVEAAPETGRTHQIRAHLAALGLPIACDGLYGEGKPIYLSQLKPQPAPLQEGEQPLISSLALHARWLEFQHPQTGELVKFAAPYPPHMESVLHGLRSL